MQHSINLSQLNKCYLFTGVEANYKLLLPQSLLSGLFFSPPTHVRITNLLNPSIAEYHIMILVCIYKKRLRYGVSLERGPFYKRTADYIWMFIFGACSLLVMAAIPILRVQYLSVSLVSMIVYVWGRNFPNELVDIHGFVELKVYMHTYEFVFRYCNFSTML